MYNQIQKQLEILDTKIRFFGETKVEDHLHALDQVGELGGPLDAQHIACYVFSGNRLIAQKTATIIRKLLTKKEMKTEWRNLYSCFSYCFGYGFSTRRQHKLKKFTYFAPDEKAHLYGIASLSANGYIREKALNAFLDFSSPEVLPYVLLRLNDWIPQVRSKAREVLDKILPSTPVTDLIKYSDLIEWLQRTTRVNLQDVHDKIFVHLHDPRYREDLFRAMEKATFRERLFCWRAMAAEVANDDDLIDKAIADPAPEIRQWAAAHLMQSKDFRARLLRLLADRAVRVRSTALKAVPQEDFAAYLPLFEMVMFDDNKSIREYARYVLRTHDITDHAEKYRQRLADRKGDANSGTIAGLAETGTKDDIALIKDYLDHKKPKVRAAALTGLGRLEVENIAPLCLQALQDHNARVRNSGISILQSSCVDVRPELQAILQNGAFKSQKAALKVLTHSGILDSLQNILLALTDPNPALHKVAWQYLTSWHHHYATKLWFNFSDSTYHKTMELIDNLQEAQIKAPDRARPAWNSLPNIMKTISR